LSLNISYYFPALSLPPLFLRKIKKWTAHSLDT
jgi:hypothetical protein